MHIENSGAMEDALYQSAALDQAQLAARATASVRRCTCSLSKMWRLCPLTVSSARNSRSPIAWFDSPSR